MANITLAIEGSRVGSYRFTREIDTTDTLRILTAYAAQMQPIRETAPDGTEATRSPTPQEIVDHIADGFLRGVLANVLRYEQVAEAERAAAAVRLIEVRT